MHARARESARARRREREESKAFTSREIATRGKSTVHDKQQRRDSWNMAGGFDNVSQKEAISVQQAKDGWCFSEMQNEDSQSRAGVVLRCMKTAWNRGSSE